MGSVRAPGAQEGYWSPQFSWGCEADHLYHDWTWCGGWSDDCRILKCFTDMDCYSLFSIISKCFTNPISKAGISLLLSKILGRFLFPWKKKGKRKLWCYRVQDYGLRTSNYVMILFNSTYVNLFNFSINILHNIFLPFSLDYDIFLVIWHGILNDQTSRFVKGGSFGLSFSCGTIMHTQSGKPNKEISKKLLPCTDISIHSALFH